MDPAGFVRTYFIDPIRTGSGYNMVNTTAYAIGFVAFIYVIFEGLKRKRITVERFALAFAPYIVLTCLVRALVDIHVYPRSIFTVSPGIYGTSFIVTVISIVVGYQIERVNKTPWDKASAYIGTVLLLMHLPLMVLLRPMAFAAIFGLTALCTLFVYQVLAISGREDLLIPENVGVIAGQLLDASATYIGLAFIGFKEQHVVPNLLFKMAGTPLIFLPVKAALAVLVVYVVDKDVEDRQMARFVKLAAFVLGFGPGLRDAFQVLMAG